MEKSNALTPRTMDAFINLRRVCAQVSINHGSAGQSALCTGVGEQKPRHEQ